MSLFVIFRILYYNNNNNSNSYRFSTTYLYKKKHDYLFVVCLCCCGVRICSDTLPGGHSRKQFEEKNTAFSCLHPTQTGIVRLLVKCKEVTSMLALGAWLEDIRRSLELDFIRSLK